MKTLSEKELDFLYWCLVDYCETNIPQELPHVQTSIAYLKRL